MADGSRSLLEALDGIRNVLASSGGINFPRIARGPLEQVLAFTSDELIVLKGVPNDPYFSSRGVLVDFQHNVLPGMTSQLSFPIKGLDLDDTLKWPPVQPEPFDEPPRDPTNTTGHGYSKQAYFFGGGDSLVTVGPSLPKIARLKNGGAQFWVSSIGVITQGTGKYKGARGVSAYNGSSYFETWPASREEQIKNLQAGFKALVSAYFKLVLADSVVAAAPPAAAAPRAQSPRRAAPPPTPRKRRGA
jgi:hypothetical protein